MWPSENPWPLILLATILGTGSFLVWFQRKDARYLAGTLACLLLSGGAWYLERVWVTPREEVEAAVFGITESFQQGNTERTAGYVSEQAPALRLMIGTAINLIEVRDDMRVSDVLVELYAQNTRAKSRFRVNATVQGRNGGFQQYQPTRWEAKWQLEAGQWKMIDIIELDPITGEEMDRLELFRGQVRMIYPNS